MAVLHERFMAALGEVLGDRLPADADPLLAASKNPAFGDFQANAAMGLGKRLGIKPRELAGRIVDRLDVADIAEPPEVAGPGFINITLKPEALSRAVASMDEPGSGGFLGIERPMGAVKETVVVDLCGVNLAKQMHVGHLRATVIGDCLARLYERLGHEVIRQNHFGDWGLPIAMVTDRVKRKAEAGELDLDSLTLEHLEGEYREAKRLSDLGQSEMRAIKTYGLGPKVEAEWEAAAAEGAAHRESARRTLVALQSGDAEVVKIWQRISEVTLEACFANCARLGAKVTSQATAGESTYRDELKEVVRDLEARGVAEESNGALIVRLDDFGINEPCLVRKRDGGFLYATTDIAAIRRRVQGFGADRVIYAVDARQSLHFRQVFAASIKAGYATKPEAEEPSRLVHAAFGTVLGADGRPFATRSGENVKLTDLLDEAVSRAEAAVAEKNPDLSEAERREIARAVGIGAIKYADLSSDRVKDYVFDFDRMLAFEGNTGPYLQYAHVRTASILRKAGAAFGLEDGAVARAELRIAEPAEKALALMLLRFGGVVRDAAGACEPHRLCVYLFELATAFSRFFEACPVLRASDEASRLSRLRLTRATGLVLRAGLETLGLEAVERM
jgi:arginyl-tRNA synthetase